MQGRSSGISFRRSLVLNTIWTGLCMLGVRHVSRLRRSKSHPVYPRRCRGLPCGRAYGAGFFFAAGREPCQPWCWLDGWRAGPERPSYSGRGTEPSSHAHPGHAVKMETPSAEAVLRAGRAVCVNCSPSSLPGPQKCKVFPQLDGGPGNGFISSNLATLGPHLAPRK
jgi:hypothetical protein